MEKEDSWAEYFKSIQTVCPWSLSAYRQNKLKFVEGCTPILELEQYEAPTHYSSSLYYKYCVVARTRNY